MRVPAPALPALLLLLAALAGCAQGPAPAAGDAEVDEEGRIRHDVVAAHIGKPIVMEHDHADAALHAGAHNLAFVAWSSLGVELGANGFANFVLHETAEGRTLAFVAVDGDAEGGFAIADATDPGRITVAGRYRAPGSGFQEVRVTPDGRFAVLNVQEAPSPSWAGQGAAACSACIHVVNVEDLASPRLVSILPVELLGTHNMEFATLPDGALYLLYVGQPLLGTNPDPPGNRIGVARFVELPGGGAMLLPVDTFFHDTAFDAGRSFPHDVSVARHPLTGQTLAYVSHWNGGAIVFDLGAVPIREIARHAEPAPSKALAVHWFVQEPAGRADGRVIAWSAPEIGSLDDGTGVVRAYDVTDPTRIEQVGTWQLPGDLAIEGRFLLSPHTAVPDMATGLLAVAHYHAGVWVLDMGDPAQPRALGYFLPNGDPSSPYAGPIWWKKPNFDPDGFLPNVYQARWHDGLLWVTERGTGLYALKYVGPVPGAV